MKNRDGAALIAAIVLMAVNLRTVIASLPPLLSDVRADLGLSAGVAGLLTTVPVLCFGALAPVGPRLAHRVPLERILAGCALITAVSAALRGVGSTPALFAAALLCGVAVALAQSAVPVLIRVRHHARAGLLTGAYAMGLPGGATIAAATAVPLEHALGGWPESLLAWTLPALVAVGVWGARASREQTLLHRDEPGPTWGVPLAWWVSGFFGIQSIAFYSGLAWLPTILKSGGASPAAAGALQALNSLVSMVPAFLVPVIAARLRNQVGLLAVIVATAATGILGLLLAPGVPEPWVVLIGLGQGGALGVGLMLPVLRATGPRSVAALTAMALTVGYSAGALGPWLLGAVHDATGTWKAPMAVWLAITLVELAPGLAAGRRRALPAASAR